MHSNEAASVANLINQKTIRLFHNRHCFIWLYANRLKIYSKKPATFCKLYLLKKLSAPIVKIRLFYYIFDYYNEHSVETQCQSTVGSNLL